MLLRTLTVAVKLNSGAISPPSEVNIQYVGQNANAPQIQLGGVAEFDLV